MIDKEELIKLVTKNINELTDIESFALLMLDSEGRRNTCIGGELYELVALAEIMKTKAVTRLIADDTEAV